VKKLNKYNKKKENEIANKIGTKIKFFVICLLETKIIKRIYKKTLKN